MEVFCPVDAMEFPCFSGIRTFIRKNRIGRLEEWKIPFHATLNPLERENGSGIVGFHWDFYHAGITIVLVVHSVARTLGF
jgi:hypothetical protein